MLREDFRDYRAVTLQDKLSFCPFFKCIYLQPRLESWHKCDKASCVCSVTYQLHVNCSTEQSSHSSVRSQNSHTIDWLHYQRTEVSTELLLNCLMQESCTRAEMLPRGNICASLFHSAIADLDTTGLRWGMKTCKMSLAVRALRCSWAFFCFFYFHGHCPPSCESCTKLQKQSRSQTHSVRPEHMSCQSLYPMQSLLWRCLENLRPAMSVYVCGEPRLMKYW